MTTSLSPKLLRDLTTRLEQANTGFSLKYPGETGRRQPVHTVYGGAHLFKAESAGRLGSLALRSLDQFAPDFLTFARAIGLPGAEQLPHAGAMGTADLNAHLEANPDAVKVVDPAAWLAHTIYRRVIEKLRREPVEDFRIDYEDGYGNRPDGEEDGHAAQGAMEVAAGMAHNSLPPFIGIRIKPFTEELRERSVRTLDIFVSTLLAQTGGKLPDNFVVTLPKITIPEQVALLSDLFAAIEEQNGLSAGTLKMEFSTRPQTVSDNQASKEFGRVMVKYGGTDQLTGASRSSTEDLGFVLDYGKQDWNEVNLAVGQDRLGLLLIDKIKGKVGGNKAKRESHHGLML